MRRYANALYPLSALAKNILYSTVRQLPAMERQKIKCVMRTKHKVLLFTALVSEHRFFQDRRNRHHALLMVLAVDDDKIVVNVFLTDAAQLPAANSGLKEQCQNRIVTQREIIMPTAALQHAPHLLRRKGRDDRLLLLAPLERHARIETAISFLIRILNERLDRFEYAVDIGALAPCLTHAA